MKYDNHNAGSTFYNLRTQLTQGRTFTKATKGAALWLTAKESLPGPGHYSPQGSRSRSGRSLSSKSCTGLEKRFKESRTDGPGPKYCLRKELRGGVKFGRQGRSESRRNETPGPGQYESQSEFRVVRRQVIKL